MHIPGFTKESLLAVEELLFAEGQRNPLEGECGQKEKRKRSQKPRTPAQQQADKTRSQALAGKPRAGGDRSAAAKKAAETRKRCKGSSGPTSPTTTTTV